MKRAIPIFKILTFLSFIILMVPNEKFILPMVVWLVLALVGFSGVLWMILSAIVMVAAGFVYISAFMSSKLIDRLSVVAILILYFPFGISIMNVFTYPYFVSRLSYLIFTILSLITLVLIVRKLMLNNFNNNS